ncbi:MAG: pyridoxamine kinase [Clostridia bacterium]|nr:pyridoxamine kinase [Clostridia bacterium]
MQNLLKCAVINDLSGFGRCSLTVALPVISALGIQACPVPTAILSNHTGYDDFYFEDYSDRMKLYYDKWEALNLHFNSIYTGFLGSEKQVSLILDFISRFKRDDTLLFVDPVMGDNGKRYTTCDENLCNRMRELVARADIITPNLTEACILSDTPYIEDVTLDHHDQIFEIGEKLLALGPKTVVITGIRTNGIMYNFVRSRENDERFCTSSPFVAQEYCGTGDLFASLLCGYLTLGVPHKEALEKTQNILSKALYHSHNMGVPPLDGVAFEPFLKEL